MLKRPETIVLWRHWFGRSLRPGKPSNSPRGAEDASMVRRAPFPLSSLPASIEHSMKLSCVCVPHNIAISKIVCRSKFLKYIQCEEAKAKISCNEQYSEQFYAVRQNKIQADIKNSEEQNKERAQLKSKSLLRCSCRGTTLRDLTLSNCRPFLG